MIGSLEFIKGIERYCLWISDSYRDQFEEVPDVAARIRRTKVVREKSPDAGFRRLAARPHQFREMNAPDNTLIIPRVTSEHREWLQVGYLLSGSVVTDSAFQILDALLYLLPILSSRLHREWIATVCGKLKTDLRYSNTLGWNTFPMPTLTEDEKERLEQCANDILDARDLYPLKTIAELYDPEKMPAEETGEIHIGMPDFKEPTTPRTKQITNEDMPDLMAEVLQDRRLLEAGLNDSTANEVITQVLIPEIIEKRYGDLSEEQTDEVVQNLVARVYAAREIREAERAGGGSIFTETVRAAFDVSKLQVDLIKDVNPFEQGYEILARTLDKQVFGTILAELTNKEPPMTDKEARSLWERVKSWIIDHDGQEPNPSSVDALERRLGKALMFLRKQYAAKHKEDA